MKISSKQCLMQAVEGMKVLCYELMEATAGRASASTLGNCAAQADGLVKELTAKVHQVGTHLLDLVVCFLREALQSDMHNTF